MSEQDGKYWDRALTLVDGCSPVSPGCNNCWSAALAHRFQKSHERYRSLTGTVNGIPRFNGAVRLHPEALGIPRRIKKPTTFAVWNDLFHGDVQAIAHAFFYNTAKACPQHTFLVLTKRPENINKITESYHSIAWSDLDNVWVGVSVETQQFDYRIEHLLKAEVAHRFVSIEPTLGPADIEEYVGWLDWVIVGCESGPRRRSCELEWVENVVRQCKNAALPIWIKQLDINGKVSHDMSEWPEDLRVRERPW